ncbi:ribosomal RNA large subunit methyltransferase J [Ceratobasidium sp. AG-Ba]|nr:ribosomal RNA large subunit methyltransferase J [Ceratobasidium sp. AG-Ba]QRW10839.1 ribosomal RNA large subunit methyltransferase J [Ceratobasidium sp. AG-Ba]
MHLEVDPVKTVAKPEPEDPTEKYLNRALQGWRSGIIQDHFEHQRNQADYNKHDDTDVFWASKMYDSMAQMNHVGRFVRAKRFLDIGLVWSFAVSGYVTIDECDDTRCCPGGYATYVMRACPDSTGMGISLPVSEGGHGPAIPPDLLPRIELKMHDLMSYDLAPSKPKPYSLAGLSLSRVPFKPNSFDFVICDGHYLRLSPDNDRRPWNWTRLLISQLLLGLRAVSSGGSMFIKLAHVERPLTARILLALCRIGNHVRTIKSQHIHVYRGSFYVSVQGVRTESDEYDQLLKGLERLWYVMTFEGRDGYGRDITWEEQDSVMPWTDVMSPHGIVTIRIVALEGDRGGPTAESGPRMWVAGEDTVAMI